MYTDIMRAKHSPHDVCVLLHHYYSPEKWPNGDTGAYRRSIAKWVNLGFIKNGRATDEGLRFIARMLSKE